MLNLQGNTLVDKYADAFDLYPLEELNMKYLGADYKKDTKKATGPKKLAPPPPPPPNQKGADDSKNKNKVPKKPIKRRILQKVT